MSWHVAVSILLAVPTDADGKCSLAEVAASDYGHLAAQEGTRPVKDFVGVAMITAGVRVAGMLVVVTMCRHLSSVKGRDKRDEERGTQCLSAEL